jgi:CheY-like chemotaxis protein
MQNLLVRTLGESIEVKVSGRADPSAVRIDSAQLETALLNLAVNARDAMPEGGRLSIETANAEIAAGDDDLAAGRYVVVSVSDTGIGMTPDVAARAFDPFFTTKDVGRGTGLGLSMVYGFAKQSGGVARITSTPGRGTMVSLFLPAHEATAPTAMPAVRPQPGGGHGETILVVEDNQELRQVVVRQLRAFGYRLLEAADGPAALEILEREPKIDLLFSDVVMRGGVDGFTLVKLARERRPELKALLTSGFTETATRATITGSAGVPLLSKPYRREALARKIREILDE